jgi:hypothetical protein
VALLTTLSARDAMPVARVLISKLSKTSANSVSVGTIGPLAGFHEQL